MLNSNVRNIFLSSQVGSVSWRLLNYGAIATIKYAFFDKLRSYLRSDETSLKYWSETDLSESLNLDPEVMLLVTNFYNEFLNSCEKRFLGSDIKKGVINAEESKNRLFCIALMIYKFRPNLYVETGTQHGISAEFAVNFSSSINLKLKVVSFDVSSDSYIIPNYQFKHIILKKPVRKNFYRYLNKFKNNYDKIIFFHDSDHSYENMLSEFRAVWKILKPIAILSDDVNLNKSFSNFCHSKDLDFIQFNLGNGNSVGMTKK